MSPEPTPALPSEDEALLASLRAGDPRAYETLVRTPKRSFEWYAATIAANATPAG